ncbi:MAG: ribonuclease III [Chloroflexi bacterium]|nr:ribonuclease III [Chloroflexota bacterium]
MKIHLYYKYQHIRPIKHYSCLENILKVQFEDPLLLINALTHSTYVSENSDVSIGDNERLEFLGDAVLDAGISNIIFKKYPNVKEGILTQIRAKIVKGTSLASVAKRINLADYLLLGKGEYKSGGKYKTSILSNALEAVLAAIFIDKGFEATQNIIFNIFEEDFIKITETTIKDPKSKLQEIVQSKFNQLPEYKLTNKYGEGNSSLFTTALIIDGKEYTRGTGKSKLISEMKAANKALYYLSEDAEYYNCSFE